MNAEGFTFVISKANRDKKINLCVIIPGKAKL